MPLVAFNMPDELKIELDQFLAPGGVYKHGSRTKFLNAAAKEKLRREKKRGKSNIQ